MGETGQSPVLSLGATEGGLAVLPGRTVWWQTSSMPAIPAKPEAARAVRTHIGTILPAWHVDPGTIETFELVVSELVANAVTASTAGGHPIPAPGGDQPVIRVYLYSDRRRLLGEVWDQAPGCPLPRRADDWAESGRGLSMIRDLGAQWGWWLSGAGKCVWAEMSYQARAGR